jgi:hypothetical protein
MLCCPSERITDRSSAIVLLVERPRTGRRFIVDSKDITRNPLRGIAEAYEKHGANNNYPVIAILDERAAQRRTPPSKLNLAAIVTALHIRRRHTVNAFQELLIQLYGNPMTTFPKTVVYGKGNRGITTAVMQ